jgi:hypothetical protein
MEEGGVELFEEGGGVLSGRSDAVVVVVGGVVCSRVVGMEGGGGHDARA